MTKTVVFIAIFIASFSYPPQVRTQIDNRVVVYSSEDRICSEPILKQFESDTGIVVDPVFDKEAAENVMKRLIEEQDKPQADVYWANEPVHPDRARNSWRGLRQMELGFLQETGTVRLQSLPERRTLVSLTSMMPLRQRK